MLFGAAVAHGIPPEILYGIAYQESGWRQFGDDGTPLVTFDGGIGIMQITDYGNYDINRLRYDIAYNINAGCEILLNKYARAPRIGDGSKNTYENWFFAVWAYNGWVPGNDYPYKVFNWIATGPRGLWDPLPVNSVQGDWLSGGLGVPIPTPQPAHYWNLSPASAAQAPAQASPPSAPPTASAPAPAPPAQPVPAPEAVNPADQARITADGSQVYFIERGKKRPIPDYGTLQALNNRYGGDVTWVASSTLDDYQTGRQMPSVTWADNHDGVLVTGVKNGVPSNSTIYVMKDGQRHLLFNLDQIDPWDGDFYYENDIRTLPDAEMLSLPIGTPVTTDGQLISGPPPSPVYVVTDGLRQPLPDPFSLMPSSYDWNSVTVLPQVIVDTIPKKFG